MDSTIEKQLRLCPTLPTLSSVALRIIEIGGDPDIELRDVADLLSNDPALAAKVLRVANSPLYMRGRRARNLHQAMTVLGLDAALSIALSFSLGSSLRDMRHNGIDLDRYWRRALLSALAARLLGVTQQIQVREELFLAGLLQDLGMLVLDAAMPDSYAQLRDAGRDHETLPAREQQLIGADHCEAGAWLMQQWGLPQYLVLATLGSENPDAVDVPDDLATFVGSVALSGRIADIYLAQDTQKATARAVQLARSFLGMSPDAVHSLLGQMRDAIPEIESLFETTVLSPTQARGLTEQARELLEMRNLQLLRSATELQERESEYRRQASRLDHIARRDALTGVYNRRHFDEAFSERFAYAVTEGHELSLAYLDLDHFKAINDGYGHPVGDEILARIATHIQGQIRREDLLARYGGEEFVLLLPAIGPAAAQTILDRICKAVENLAHPLADGEELKVTLSAGIASYPGRPQRYETPGMLMQAADDALYRAKREGRNRAVSAA